MRRLAALVALASLAAMLAAPAGASALPPAWPGLPVLPFMHLREGNNTTNETDVAPPAIAVTSHKDRETVKESKITLRGTAADESGVRSVEVAVNGGPWANASGNLTWSLPVRLEQGRNSVSVRASDAVGNAAWQNLSIVLETPAQDNSGVLLAAAVIIPVVALILLFSIRRKATPAGETEEEHTDLEKRLGLDSKQRDGTDAGLEDSEEATRIEKPPARRKGGKARQ
jgi:hypothetical protein